jgi:hypothetical protein
MDPLCEMECKECGFARCVNAEIEEHYRMIGRMTP